MATASIGTVALFVTACASDGTIVQSSPVGTYDARVELANAAIDLHYEVSVKQVGHWPHQTWSVGCFSDDDPGNARPTGFTWTDDTHFVINMDTPGASIDVDMTNLGPTVTHHGDSEFNCYGY